MLKIYNTFKREKEEFVPVVDGKVSMYVCGPTVYKLPHLGHAKTYLNFDTIFRYLKFSGFQVKYVQNITDVGHLVGDSDDGEDKISVQSQKENIDAYEIAYKYEVEHFRNMDLLNIQRPSISCRATGFIIDIIEAVSEIVDKGYAYVTDQGNVYFDVHKYENYGSLSNRKLDSTKTGERIEGASDKKNPEDFALWKAVDKNVLMQWNSPWGLGCPGWHIECSVLSRKFLGSTFDIHGGGIDNLFPHHECECAQNSVLNGGETINYFMHNGLIQIKGEKMGASKGNFITLPEILEEYSPMTVRYFINQFHYRSNVDFTKDGLIIADKQFSKISEMVNNIRKITTEQKAVEDNELKSIYNSILDAMNDDFNMPVAVAEFLKVVKRANVILTEKDIEKLKQINKIIIDVAETIFGLKFDITNPKEEKIPENIISLAEKRLEAKKIKDYNLADNLRNQILEFGFSVVDTSDGFEIKKI